MKPSQKVSMRKSIKRERIRKMYKLTNMLFQLKMDRKINPDIHYLSPGGYEIEKDGVTYNFDFCQSSGNVDCDDDTIIVYEVNDFDEEYAKESGFTGEFKDPKDLLGYCFKDFFVFTGEDNDAEINVIELLDLTFRFSNTETTKFLPIYLKASKEQIEQINEIFKNN